jgi:hypothetical protein
MTNTAPRFGPHRNSGCRLRDYVWRGRRCVSLENETLRAVLCLDKGGDILELLHKPSDTEMLHQAPAGVTRPGDAHSSPLAAGAFRDEFPGGWYVMLPNGPVPCRHRGADYGQHGEATFLGWDVAIDMDRADRVSILMHTRLRRTPLLVERRVTLEQGRGTLVLEEQITSEAAHPIEVLWGHHPTFGAPLIEAGTRIDLPAGADLASALGVIPDDDVTLHDFTRFDAMADGWFALSNDRRGAGVALRWDEELFPTLGLWRMLGGEGDYPWYGARRMVALEPACDLPSLAEAVARGTAIVLAPGQTIATRIEATLFTPAGTVCGVAWGGDIAFAEKA